MTGASSTSCCSGRIVFSFFTFLFFNYKMVIFLRNAY
jgi:hypothetical protein